MQVYTWSRVGENVAWTPDERGRAPDMLSLVALAARRHGDRTYLKPVEPGLDPLTFEDVHAFALRLGDLLDELAAPVGERVAVVLHNSSLMTLLFLGVIAARRVLVPLNPKSGLSEVDHVLRATSPRLVLVEASSAQRLRPVTAGWRSIVVDDQVGFIRETLRRPAAPLEPGDAAPEADAEIVFTSGSTGRPKGVVLPHRSLLADAFGLGQRFGFTRDESFLTVCPLFHNSGQLFTTLTALWCGATTTCVRSDLAMLRFWPLVDRHQPTWTLVVNAFLALLVQAPGAPSRPSLKGVLAGGSRLGADLIGSFESRFAVPVYQTYGLTETTSISTVELPGHPDRAVGSAGRPLSVCSVRIVQDGGEPPAGEPGEIQVSGENLFARYLDQPELTAERVGDGWLRTGDVGYLDRMGNLFIIDRLDSMVIVGGENVYPSEVENLVPELDGVEEAVVVGVPDEIMGSRLVMVYRLRPGAEPEHARWRDVFVRHLSPFKIPERLLAVDVLGWEELPHATNGKVLRRRVQEAVLAAAAGP
jgi:acyl-CoA synthetase (AMP-forming)/AMP-acid ligase II